MATQTKSNVSDTARDALDKGYPETWIFDKDGNEFQGKFLRLETGMTREYGRQNIAIFMIDGNERSVWLMHKALASQLGSVRPRIGDMVAVRRLDKKKGAKYSYYPYRVINLDAPTSGEANWDKVAPEESAPVITSNDPPQDTDIPF